MSHTMHRFAQTPFQRNLAFIRWGGRIPTRALLGWNGAGCMFLLLLFLLVSPAHAASSVEASLRETKARADALALKVKVSEREVEALRKRTTELARVIQANESRLSSSERRAQQLTHEVATREATLKERQVQSAEAMLAMLRVEQMPTSLLLVNPGQGSDTLRAASALQAARRALMEDATRLREELAGLKRARSQLGQVSERSKNESETLRARRSLLEKELAERAVADAQLRRDQKEANTRLERLKEESKSLQQLMDNVAKQPAKTGTFSKRGSLSAPVAGEVVHRYGERKSANETYRGMVLSARSGAVVVAPSAGEVAFTGPFMNYGPMVLLRHPGGYMSLLAGLGQVDARMGQRVGAGEPVGRMGQTVPRLYVELRNNGKPIDPSGWFANVGRALAAR